MTLRRTPVPRPGFALVLALTVMAMLLLLCLSCAALLSVELRSGRVTLTAAKARLNATVAARIALGELQRLAGPDRRITANAAILTTEVGRNGDIRRPKLVGVWKGLTAEPGEPVAWSIKNLPALAPVGGYATDHENSFVGWLSSGRTRATDTGAYALTDSGSGEGTPEGWRWIKTDAAKSASDWVLMSKGADHVGAPLLKSEEDRAITATPELFSGSSTDFGLGAFAWAVMDENQKARVDLREDSSSPSDPNSRAAFSAASARRFHPGYDADGTGLWNSKASSSKSVVRATWFSLPFDSGDGSATSASTAWFPFENDRRTPIKALRHDFTTDSVSLLTDVANGGLKRDLSLLPLMAKLPDNLDGPTGYIGFEPDPVGSPAPTALGRMAWWRSAKTSTIPAPSTVAAGAFWPIWSDVREWASFATTATAAQGAAQKPFLYLSGGAPTLRQISRADNDKYVAAVKGGGVDRLYQSPWRQPILYRFRIEMALSAQLDSPTSSTYTVVPKANFIYQVWNPYNVDMDMDTTSMALYAETIAFDLRVTGRDSAGAPRTCFLRFVPWYGAGGQQSLTADCAFTGKIKAGAIHTYSVPSNPVGSGFRVTLQQGYYPGHFKRFDNSTLSHFNHGGLDGNSTLSVAVEFNRGTDNWRPPLKLTLPVEFGAPMAGSNRDGTNQNPLRMLGTTTGTITFSAMEPVRLISETGDNTMLIFENRLKSEAVTGAMYSGVVSGDSGGDEHRFWAGEPPGIFSRFWLNDGRKSTWYAAPYESVLWSRYGYSDAENKYPLEVDGDSGELGFGGTGYSSNTGLTSHIYHRIPLHPPVGLLSLRHARIGGGIRPVFITADSANRNAWLCNVHNAFGNSLIAPYVPTKQAVGDTAMPSNYTGDPAFIPYDMSWLMNSAIADSWFVSSLGAWDTGVAASLFPETAKTAEVLFNNLHAGTARLPDRRLVPDTLSGVPDSVRKGFLGANVATPDAYRKLASTMLVEGGFNLNSTSVRAWRAFLASAHADTSSTDSTGILVHDGTALKLEAKAPGTTTVTTADIVNAKPTATPASDGAGRVNGGRVLSEAELDKLAQAIVAEVKKRGPFLSVSEFLNRRLEDGETGYKGAMQTAIDAAGLNAHLATTGRALSSPGMEKNLDLAKVYTHSGVNQPGWLSQADLLAPLASAMTARGDTFVIRVSATAPEDNAAPASLEITVRRTYAYMNAADTDDTEFLNLKDPINRAFGRRFVVLNYRWLAAGEI